MENIIKQWKEMLDEFSSCVEKSVEEVRQCKASVQAMKPDIVNRQMVGKYIRDDNRIIISAPEIIIGNVDKDGILWGDGSEATVTIKGNDVSLHGVSNQVNNGIGSITCKASKISNIAVDPGIDGNEDVVCNASTIINQAQSISLATSQYPDLFPSYRMNGPGTGIYLHSDTIIDIDASSSSKGLKKNVEDEISQLKKQKTELKKEADGTKKSMKSTFEEVEKIIKECEEQSNVLEDIRCNIGTFDDIRIAFEEKTASLASTLRTYMMQLSLLAETCRKITALDKIKGSIPSESDLKQKTTNTSVAINGEMINLSCIDGDNNIRTNKESHIDLNAQKINIRSQEHNDALLKDGAINLNAQQMNISTADTKYKDPKKRDSGDIVATGDIHITSKTMTVEGTDCEFTEKETKEKALSAEGRLNIRFTSTNINATDTKGKATGNISLNAKDIEIKSFDVKEKERTDDKIAAGSSLLITAEKVYAGSKDKNNKTKQFQVVAENTGVFGDSVAEVQQGDGKAILQLSGGNAAIAGSKSGTYGETTVNGKTTFNGDVTAPKVSAKNLEASSSFKSTNISDGIAVPAPPSTSKLSAKLKTEEKK